MSPQYPSLPCPPLFHELKSNVWFRKPANTPPVNLAALGMLRPAEEFLILGRSVYLPRFDLKKVTVGGAYQLRVLMRHGVLTPGMVWSLLDHLATSPVRWDGKERRSMLTLVEGQWGSIGGEPCLLLDVNRVRRFLQLLGMLEHSRVEEFRRGLEPR